MFSIHASLVVIIISILYRFVHTLSNGVGKSTLAMAALWALAGTVDPRPAQDGKVSDVVNDFCKVAEVSLRGSINNKPFSVTRTKSTSSQGSSLTFVLDGKVLTQQSILGTQQLIDHHFSIGSQILMRTIFHGQHTIGGLLESSDAKLKEELSHLVSLEIWQQSASLARSKQRELLRKASELEGMLSLRAKDKMRAEEKARAAKEEVQRREPVRPKRQRVTLRITSDQVLSSRYLINPSYKYIKLHLR
jgi:DNA repair exonuclease SbcCD ATPase subunit